MIRRTKLVIVASAVLLVIVLLSVYFVQNIYSNNGKTAYSTVINGLQLSVTVNETTHRQGDNIYATLTLTNVNNKNVSTDFIDSGAYFELFVYNSENKFEAAKEDSGGLFKTPIMLSPNSSINKTFNWLTDAPYYYPKEGTYQFVGLIAESSGHSIFKTAPIYITLSKELTTTPTS
jgi:hypothetical protein